MATPFDPFVTVQQPMMAVPPTPPFASPASESVRGWTTRYAGLSALFSVISIVLTVMVIAVATEGASGFAWSLAAGMFFMIFGVPVALIVALVTAHTLVSLPVLTHRPDVIRPIFATFALVFGFAPIGLYVRGDVAPMIAGAVGLLANAAAVSLVWHRMGKAPGA